MNASLNTLRRLYPIAPPPRAPAVIALVCLAENTRDRIVPYRDTPGSIRYQVRTGPATTLTVREHSERGNALPAIGSEVTLCWRASDTLLIVDED
jgi:hypothetical protein